MREQNHTESSIKEKDEKKNHQYAGPKRSVIFDLGKSS